MALSKQERRRAFWSGFFSVFTFGLSIPTLEPIRPAPPFESDDGKALEADAKAILDDFGVDSWEELLRKLEAAEANAQ